MENTNLKHHMLFEVADLPTYLKVINYIEKEYLKDDPTIMLIYRGQSIDKPLWPKIGRPEYKRTNRVYFEKAILNEFKKLSLPHTNTKHDNWDLIAIAQHYGLPTRLLDWSGNPLIALWFALTDKPEMKPTRVVWSFAVNQTDIQDTETGTPYEQNQTRVFQPMHITPRIVAQNSWFTSHYYRPKNNQYTAFDYKRGNKEKLCKIKIIADEEELNSAFIQPLNTYGINAYSIFPDLAGLCKHLDWKHFKNHSVAKGKGSKEERPEPTVTPTPTSETDGT